jgi:aminopeptidase-like protein
MYDLAVKLWPICRSLTGDGVRETLSIINEILPLKIYEVPSGTKVYDWEVPDEWNIKAAYIYDDVGNKIIDFNDNNLHIVNGSIPIDEWFNLDELQKHLYSDEKIPNAIPYITSYYKRDWGFCLTHDQRKNLRAGKYHVVIDSELKAGNLTYGECILKGKTNKEVLISTYICHPSMANNELSGPVLITYLGKWLKELDREYTYRIIFIPETIGALVYMNYNEKQVKENTIAAINASCVGDDRCYSFISSRYGNTLSDKIARHILSNTDKNYNDYSFLERGSNERIFCAPGFDLPMVNITRSAFRKYPEYHTSLDNLDLISAEGLKGSFDVYTKFIMLIENNDYYMTMNYGEPRLKKRELYEVGDNNKKLTPYTQIIVDFLSYADGTNDVIDIANIIKVPAWELHSLIKILLDKGLIRSVEKHTRKNA